MIISKSYNFVFIAVPKTGTSSIEKRFKETLKENCEVISKSSEQTNSNFHKHTTLNELLNSATQYQNMNYFGFVRNPWAKIVSWYTYLKIADYSPYYIGDQNLSFEDFIECAPNFVFFPSAQFLTVDSGIKNTFVGKFENIEHDYKKMCSIIGIECLDLPHINKSNFTKKHFTEYYNKHTKSFVETVCKKDIEMFNYKFEDD